MPSGAPPFPSAASRGSPAAGLPAAHSLVRQFGLPLGAVLSQRGTGIGAARETHSSRRPVSENRRFSIRLFTRRGNSAGRPGRELQAVRLHRGRIPRPGCFNGILGPAPQDRHESRPCPCGQGLLSCFDADGADRAAVPGLLGRLQLALRDAAAVGQTVVAHVNTSGQVPAHRPQPMQFSFTVAFILVTPIIPEYFHPGPVSPPARE